MSAKNIENIIKNAIEAGVDPPKEMWDRISNQLDVDDVWQRVENQLDVDQVWGNVSKEMATAEKLDFFEKISYVPLLLFLLFFGYQPQKESKTDLFGTKITKNDLNLADAIDQSINPPMPTPVYQESARANDRMGGLYTGNIQQLALDEKSTLVSESYDRLNPNSWLVGEGVNLASVELPFIETEEEVVIPEIVIEPTKTPVRWYVGPSLALKNSWLINYKTIQGYETIDLVNASAKYASDISLQAGVFLNPKWAIQSDIFIHSGVGQKYGEYVGAQYMNRDIQLNYSGMQLMGKYTMSSTSYANYSMNKNWMLGGYGNMLRSATEKQFWHLDESAVNLDVKDNYNALDFGLVVGYEFELFTNAGISLSSGLQFKYGLSNVFGGDEIIPGQFKRTNTASVGINTAIRFYGKTKR